MSFGLSEQNIKVLRNEVQRVFGDETDLKVYLFGSRASGKYRKNSDIDLALKSKEPNLGKKIQRLKENLENSNIPYKCDLVNWDEIISEYLPKIKKDKKLFWSKKDVVRTNPWRVCPIGYHWVKEHLKKGNTDFTDSHCRRNRSGKDLLKSDEIHQISNSNLFKKAEISASKNKLGYNGKENKYDLLINGWCAYWNDMLKIDPPLHPNIVKVLIATESSFDANPQRDKNHLAIGLMQLMPKTMKLLSSDSKELKNHFLEISEEEALDPNVNICAGIRWLFRKYELIKKKKKDANWIDAIEEYKGISKQSGMESDKIRNKISKFHSALIKKK